VRSARERMEDFQTVAVFEPSARPEKLRHGRVMTLVQPAITNTARLRIPLTTPQLARE
jgi:hypothetical protein